LDGIYGLGIGFVRVFFVVKMVCVGQCRRWMLERKLADADVSREEQMNILKKFEEKETEYMRRQRHKMGVDDFELLTIIGRGAFGEVFLLSNFFLKLFFLCCIRNSLIFILSSAFLNYECNDFFYIAV
jgi:hypothetical protein